MTDMSEMFQNATSFNQPLNNWNVSNVTNMNEMFRNEARYRSHTSSFNQPLNKWNVSNVTHMYRMFQNATSFNQPLNDWNVSNVKSMHSMFAGATSFNQPLNNWNVSSLSWHDNDGAKTLSARTRTPDARRLSPTFFQASRQSPVALSAPKSRAEADHDN